jgi:thioredoxin-related protein
MAPKHVAPTSKKQIIVFHQHGCPACADYLPRFKRLAVKYRGLVNIQLANMSTTSEELFKKIAKAADRYKIDGAPTTIVLDANDQFLRRVVGSVSNAEIAKLFEFAAR